MTFKVPKISQHDPFGPFFQTAETPSAQCSELCMVFQLHRPSAGLLNTLQELLPPVPDNVHYDFLRQFPHSFGSCSLFSIMPALQPSLFIFLSSTHQYHIFSDFTCLQFFGLFQNKELVTSVTFVGAEDSTHMSEIPNTHSFSLFSIYFALLPEMNFIQIIF